MYSGPPLYNINESSDKMRPKRHGRLASGENSLVARASSRFQRDIRAEEAGAFSETV